MYFYSFHLRIFVQDQRHFNNEHSRQRCCIERAFGLLKCKWRKLKYLDVTNLEFLTIIIVAACVLHNFIIEIEGEDEDFEISDDESDDEDEYDNENDDPPDNDAVEKRDRISASL